MDLKLDVRIDGFAEPAAVLVRDGNGALALAYTTAHLINPHSFPLSLSLPLTEEPYGDVNVRPFFDNLLQERDGGLAQVMAREGLARDDIAGLLFHLGKDCPGALSVLPLGSPPTKVPGDYNTDYSIVSDERMVAIVDALHRRQRMPEGTGDPSPLSGVQSKIAITILPNGDYALPKDGTGAPTTHILKVPDQGHLQDAVLEAEAMYLASSLGLEMAQVEVRPFGPIRALLIKRFDRDLNAEGKIIRIHQEDFAQALGLPAALKYERNGSENRRFDAKAIGKILDRTINTTLERDRFIATTLLNMMVGNVDAHAKNHAILYRSDGQIAVAPGYDILPTRLDPSLTNQFAFKIGNAETLDDMTRADFGTFLTDLGIPSASMHRRLINRHATRMAAGLAARLDELRARGMSRFTDLIGSNIEVVMSAFELRVPPQALKGDAFMDRGGGWLTS